MPKPITMVWVDHHMAHALATLTGLDPAVIIGFTLGVSLDDGSLVVVTTACCDAHAAQTVAAIVAKDTDTRPEDCPNHANVQRLLAEL